MRLVYQGGLGLVQQSQPLQLHVWIVTQNLTEGSIGQVSNICGLPNHLLQAFCQAHGPLKGLCHQLEVLLQGLCCSCGGRWGQQLVKGGLKTNVRSNLILFLLHGLISSFGCKP